MFSKKTVVVIGVFFLIIAISSGLGTGTNALASRHLGKKDRSGFGVVVTNAFFLGLVSAVLLTLLGYLISPFLFDLLGATEHRAIARDALRKSLVLLKN